jgi:hypothetical protein
MSFSIFSLQKKKDHGGQKLTMVVKHQEVWSIGETDSFAAERAGLHSRQMAQGLPGRIESKWLSDEEVKEAVNLQLDEVELFRQLFEQVLTYYTVRLALSSYCQISCKYTCQAAGPGQTVLHGKAAVGFFSRSGLPTATLKKIWEICDRKKKGHLTRAEFVLAARLVALSQVTFMVVQNVNISISQERTWHIPSFLNQDWHREHT